MTELWDRSSSYSFPRLRSVKVALPSAHVNEVIVSDGAVKLRVTSTGTEVSSSSSQAVNAVITAANNRNEKNLFSFIMVLLNVYCILNSFINLFSF